MAGKSKRDLDDLLKRLAAPEREPSTADLTAGTLVDGRYRIVRAIGRGGMGDVYEAEHERIARRVALKCLKRELAKDREALLRFEAEARAASRVGDPHIVEVMDLGDLPDGRPFMCMELLEGVTWDRVLAEGPVPIARVVHVVAQLADALGAAHARGIVHRDLKPSNVFLVTRQGDASYVKLGDFGVAKMLAHPSTRLTSTGVALGTPAYMAPEQALGDKTADHRVDIHALGVLAFESLTGQRPYEAKSTALLLVRICNDPVPDLAALRPDLPAALCRVVSRALQKDPAARFSSCEELKRALLSAVPAP